MMLLKLAWRNLRRNKRRTLLTLGSIAVGCAFAIFFVALGTGAQKQMVNSATRLLAGHITIEDRKFRDEPAASLFVPSVAKVKAVAAKMPDVEVVKVLCADRGVVASATGATAVSFLGVEPEQEKEVSQIARGIIRGRFIESADLETRGVVVGVKLAERLHVDLGNKLVLTLTSAQGDVVQELIRIVGIFKLGSDALDGGLIEMPIALSRKVMGLTDDQATQVGFVLKRPEAQEAVLEDTKRALADERLAVEPWQRVIPVVAAYVSFANKRQHQAAAIILFLACFAILNTILMSLIERKREFATLLALGTPPRFLRTQVFIETLFLGIAGSAVGVLIGGTIAYVTGRRGIDISGLVTDAPVAGVPLEVILHPALALSDVSYVVGVVLLATSLIAIYPTVYSTRIKLADTLRSS